MPKPKISKVVGFSFQEIPLEEAQNAVLAGDGNYSEIKQTLLEKLPNLPPDKAFAFGLPNGKEVPEEHRRGLCMAINATLKQAKLNWRTTYSGIRKLFLCIPRTVPRTYEKQTNGYVPRSRWNQMDNTEIVKLWKAGNPVPAIIKLTGAHPEHVKYVCYQQLPRKPRISAKHSSNGKLSDAEKIKNMEVILADASRIFKITPKKLQKRSRQDRAVRKAICVVASQHNIAARIIAPYVGLSREGVIYTARQQHTTFGKKEIAELQEALGR